MLVTGDWHLSAHGAWRGRGITGDAEFGIAQIRDLVRADASIASLVVLGDNHEAADVAGGTPDQLAMVRDVLAELGRPVFYVLGNHDLGVDWWRLVPAARNVDGTTFELPGLPGRRAYGMSYTPAPALVERLAAIPRGVSVLLAHQRWAELGHGAPDAIAADLGPRGIRWLLTGDFHASLDLDCAGVRLLSPGPICAQSVAELGPKSVLLLSIDADDALTVREAPLRVRPHVEIHVATEEELDRVCGGGLVAAAEAARRRAEGLPDALREPILVVRLARGLPGGVTRVRRAARGLGHLFLPAPPACSGPEAPTEPGHVPVGDALVAATYAWPGLSSTARALASDLADPAARPRDVIRAHREAVLSVSPVDLETTHEPGTM